MDDLSSAKISLLVSFFPAPQLTVTGTTKYIYYINDWNHGLLGGQPSLWLASKKQMQLCCSGHGWLVPGWPALFSCTFGFCSLYSGSESRESSAGRVMVWRLRKQKSSTKTQTAMSGASLFCCERSESPAGGAALTICQKRHASFAGRRRSWALWRLQLAPLD